MIDLFLRESRDKDFSKTFRLSHFCLKASIAMCFYSLGFLCDRAEDGFFIELKLSEKVFFQQYGDILLSKPARQNRANKKTRPLTSYSQGARLRVDLTRNIEVLMMLMICKLMLMTKNILFNAVSREVSKDLFYCNAEQIVYIHIATRNIEYLFP